MMDNVVKSGTNKNLEFIAFRLGQQEFCVDVMRLREIRGWTPATPVPHSPSAMLGVINLRGFVLPIIDLAIYLGFAPATPSSRHAIMVVEIGQQTIGILVEAVSEIFMISEGEIQPTPDVALERAKNVIHGVISLEGRMIGIISLDDIQGTAGPIAA
jgi:purine-binding chemotaxis protein CheW